MAFGIRPPEPGEVKIMISDDCVACYGQCKECETIMDYRLKFPPIVRANMSEQELVREALRRMNDRHDCPAAKVMPWPTGAPIEDFLRFGARMEPERGLSAPKVAQA